jgi:hypothetical protein
MSAAELENASVDHAAMAEPVLQGRWLTAARSTWIVVATGIVVLTAVGFVGGLRNWELFGSKSIHAAITAAGLPVTAVSVLGLLVPHVIYVAAGILIFARRSSDWRAMLFSLTLIAVTALRPLMAAERAVPGMAPVVEAAWLLALFLILTLLLIFPDGRLVPSWTWILMLTAVPTVIAISRPMRAVLLLPDPPPADAITGFRASVVVILIYFGTGFGAQILRFRSASRVVERQQIKWVGFALSALLITLLLGFAVPALFIDTHNAWFAWGMLATVPLFLFVPAAVAIAVLRYRLFAIDHIISRTLAYAALTLLLAAVYISVVMVLASPMAGRSNLAVAAATLAVAALFRPAQRSIQEMIDRHFNRRRYDLSRTIAEFGHRVQNETDPTQLERELVGVVQDILQPNTMSLWAMRRSARRSLG